MYVNILVMKNLIYECTHPQHYDNGSENLLDQVDKLHATAIHIKSMFE